MVVQAIESAGYFPGEDVLIGIDCAASEFYKDGKYHLAGEGLQLTPSSLSITWPIWPMLPDRLDRGRHGRRRLGRLETADRTSGREASRSSATTFS
jgi:hypothetical protein